MSSLFDSIAFIERIVAITKKYQAGEQWIKKEFEEKLEEIIQRIIQFLSRLEEVLTPTRRSERAQKNNAK